MLIAFNLPFQPGEVLLERAGTNCAHSFRFPRDEQNMIADSCFDVSFESWLVKYKLLSI